MPPHTIEAPAREDAADSNTISAVILLAGAAILARGVGREPRGFTVARMAVATYMIITGVVYNLLLRSSLAQGATVAWSNEVLHVVAPVYLALDWFLARGRNPMTRRDALLALVFPVIWLVYTMVRGPSATDPYTTNTYWYPYPFLNPVTSAGGYAQVSGFIVGIALVVVAVAYGARVVVTPARPGDERRGAGPARPEGLTGGVSRTAGTGRPGDPAACGRPRPTAGGRCP